MSLIERIILWFHLYGDECKDDEVRNLLNDAQEELTAKEQENAKLRAELAALRAAPRKLVEWRNNTTPEALPFRVENHDPATVEQDEWRSV